MLYKVTHCAGCDLANTRHHQMCCSDQEMGTAVLCRKQMQSVGCSYIAQLTHKVDRSIPKAVRLQQNKQICNVNVNVYNSEDVANRWSCTHMFTKRKRLHQYIQLGRGQIQSEKHGSSYQVPIQLEGLPPCSSVISRLIALFSLSKFLYSVSQELEQRN